MVHPKHAGFVLGGGGKTMKGIGSKYRVHIRLHNSSDGHWPYFKVVGSSCEHVEQAFLALRDVANIAYRKIPVELGGYQGQAPVSPKVRHSHAAPQQLPEKYEPKSPDYTPSSPGYAPTSPPYIPTDEKTANVEKLTVDDKEWLVELGDGGVRKVFSEAGDVIGVYIVAEKKVVVFVDKCIVCVHVMCVRGVDCDKN